MAALPDGLVECECDHLTDFAATMSEFVPSSNFSVNTLDVADIAAITAQGLMRAHSALKAMISLALQDWLAGRTHLALG